MKYLVIDTSSLKGIFSILEDEQVLFKKELSFGIRESNELVPMIEMGLNETSLTFKDIDRILLSEGPGSFTGLRIGASVAKGISYASSIPIIPIESMKCFAPSQKGTFSVLLDAKAKGIFVQNGRCDQKNIFYEDLYKKCDPKQLIDELNNKDFIICSDKNSLQAKVTPLLFEKITELSPDPLQMLQIALKKPLSSFLKSHEQIPLKYFNSPSGL